MSGVLLTIWANSPICWKAQPFTGGSARRIAYNPMNQVYGKHRKLRISQYKYFHKIGFQKYAYTLDIFIHQFVRHEIFWRHFADSSRLLKNQNDHMYRHTLEWSCDQVHWREIVSHFCVFFSLPAIRHADPPWFRSFCSHALLDSQT